MSDRGLAVYTFPSHTAASSARTRLTRAGFARNSIDIKRRNDAFEVSIRTREENRERAEQILTGSPLGDDLLEAGGRAVDAFQGNRFLVLGLAALAGFALFGLTART